LGNWKIIKQGIGVYFGNCNFIDWKAKKRNRSVDQIEIVSNY